MRLWFGRSGALGKKSASKEAGTLGYLDTIEVGQVRGWAHRPQQPDRRVRVRILVDGRGVAEAIADRYRRDLAATDHGDGSHGFDIALPTALLDGLQHQVDAVDAETGERLRVLCSRYRLTPAPDPAQAALVALFDRAHYEAQAGSVLHPLDHYREIGWQRGYDPHPLFSTQHYLDQYGPLPDDPLTHFAEVGQWAGAWTHPFVDLSAEPVSVRPRRSSNDGAAEEIDTHDRQIHPLLGYLAGAGAPRQLLSRYFRDEDYLGRYPEIAEDYRPPLLHYLARGYREGRRPTPSFDPILFAKLAGLKRGIEPYTHFLSRLEGKRRLRRNPSRTSGNVAGSLRPQVSIIVLNYNMSLLTLQALYFIEVNTDLTEVEIIIVDNGSRAEEFALLARQACGVTLVRLSVNRGFGEGNNLGAERANGRLLVFLNNDAFVRPGWLEPLRAALDADDTVGAAGAKLLYPDGRLQEAGAVMSACGTAIQRGKHLDPRAPAFNRQEPVDYCSAAALMVRANAFRAALGFDLCWDPAYYEDADLCLKLRAMGLATVYVPASEVVHLEHATSADARLDLRLHDIVATNRLKFVARWGDHLAQMPGASGAAPARTANENAVSPTRTAALFTPYTLAPGGGERYLLTIAACLRHSHRCILLTPDHYSRLRLLTVGRDLGLDLDHVEVSILSEVRAGERFDLFVCMANEVLPPMPGLGRVNLYHCQFPFPMHPDHYARSWRTLATYQAVVANSRFTARHYSAGAAALGQATPPVRVLSPPVPQRAASGKRRVDGVTRILSVGRFDPGGHCKRQDLMIEAFRSLIPQVERPLELHLVGAIAGESASRVHFQQLVEAARDLPVVFHPNISAEAIGALNDEADLYWHLTGAGEDVRRHPEVFEHFGIALAEAMSAGAVPVALGLGGPAEIINDGRDGVLIDHVRDLVPATERLLSDPVRRDHLSAAARVRAAAFAPQAFAAGLRALVAEFDGEPAVARPSPPGGER